MLFLFTSKATNGAPRMRKPLRVQLRSWSRLDCDALDSPFKPLGTMVAFFFIAGRLGFGFPMAKHRLTEEATTIKSARWQGDTIKVDIELKHSLQ